MIMVMRLLLVASCVCHAVIAFAPPNVRLGFESARRAIGASSSGASLPKPQNKVELLRMAIDGSRIKAISLDVTGTILVHSNPIMETYAAAAIWARLPNPPSVEVCLCPSNLVRVYKHMRTHVRN